jgi:uncharacterized membrane protein
MPHCKLVPVLAFSINPSVFWPYAAGAAILVIGLPVVIIGAARRARGIDKLTAFGPLLFGIAMAVFGADHFIAAKFVAAIVPSWIPWHLFWAYFVGVALIVGALSFATTIQWRLAAGSYALMFLIFELTMHIPNLIAVPDSKPRIILLLRDLPFLAAGLAFALANSGEAAPSTARSGGLLSPPVRRTLAAIACVVMAIPIGVFGVEHFLNPDFAPGIPQENPAVMIPMPEWLPAHVLWIYVTGAIFVVSAIGLISIRYARSAALLVGATVLVAIALVYIPLTIAKAADVDNGLNYLCIHFALAGSALMLAAALPARSAAPAGVPEVAAVETDQVAETRSRL